MKRKRRSRSIILGSVLALTSSLMVVLPAAPAHAACYGATCKGRDPVDQNCAGTPVPGTSLWDIPRERWGMYMVHSSGCSARWTSLNVASCFSTGCVRWRITITRQRPGKNGGWITTDFSDKLVDTSPHSQFNTPMVADNPDPGHPERFQSCYRDEPDTGPGPWQCSSWVT